MLSRRVFVSTLGGAALAASRLPNIVFILADDLGWGDLGCYNPQSKIPTPNLDRLAAQGMRFTDAHSPSAVCTPTRYGLLTGQYAWRTRLEKGVFDGFDPPLIPPDRLTVASLLRRRGYRTACVGKWHLGMTWTDRDGKPLPERTQGGFRPGFDVDYTKPVTGGPNDVGFDEYFGISASLDMPPYCFLENRRTVGVPDSKLPADRTLYMNQPEGAAVSGFRYEDVLPACTRRATEFIARQRGRSQPFFLYMPLSAPHLPVVPNREFQGKSKSGLYGDFVVEMDASVGAVLDAIERAGFEQNTLVMFSSDNGGLWHGWDFREPDDIAHGKPTPRAEDQRKHGHQSNAWMRGTKADAWEGGHRVPLLARWPGRIKAGAVSGSLVCLTDFLATCAAIAGDKLPAGAAGDSVNLVPTLRDAKRPARDHLVSHSINGVFAIREGDWKLIPTRGSGGFSVPRTVTPKPGEPPGQLYNLRLDPGETRNVYLDHPDIVRKLEARLARIRVAKAM